MRYSSKRWLLVLITCGIVGFLAWLFLGNPKSTGWAILLILVFILPMLFAWCGLKSLKLLIWINILYGVIFLATNCIYVSMGGPWWDSLQLLCMALMFYGLVLFVISFVAGIIGFRRDDSIVLFLSPIVILIVTFFMLFPSFKLGHKVRIHIFNKRLTQYEKAVAMLSNQIEDKRIRLHGDEIPKEFRHLAYYHISVERRSQNILVATFWWKKGGGFPAKHTIYVYSSQGEFPSDEKFRREWPRWYRINKNWFCASD